MRLIDTHAHLYLNQFQNDSSEVVNNARNEGVSHIILPNIDENSILPLLSFCDSFPKACIPALAIHPTSVYDNYSSQLKTIEQHLNLHNFLAIGETGIDLYWDKSLYREQCSVFEKHIELAIKHDLPLIIHSRNSLEEIFSILHNYKNEKLQGVFHCYPGDIEQAYKIIDLGFMLGIGGVVTYKNSLMSKVVFDIDLKHMLLETDAPYLAPVPYRGKRNESSYLVHIAEKIAQIKKISVIEVAEITTDNAVRLFKIR